MEAAASPLRALPSVEKLTQALGETGLPRPVVVSLVRRELAGFRERKEVPSWPEILSHLEEAVQNTRLSRIQPVINATGILLHTNLGRAPLNAAVADAVREIASHYNNLEFDLVQGERGGRAAYLEENLARLCGAEAATVVNNNAAALVLILQHFCQETRSEVIVSRGELIQIGGGFRIPDILETGGAHLREVGTTNKTSLDDYARAIRPETALIMKVHRSNFWMEGFVESPSTEELAALSGERNIPLVEDLGSGALIRTVSLPGLPHEPTPAEVLAQGVSLVCFSGDKLLGGPQAGIIAGEKLLVSALKREPIFRALRCDKLVLTALQATIDCYLAGEPSELPALSMLKVPLEELRRRAVSLCDTLLDLPLTVEIGTGKAEVGGGTLPQARIPSVTLDLLPNEMTLEELSQRLRRGSPPVVGYIGNSRVKLDLRTVFPYQDELLAAAIRACLSSAT